MEVSVRADDPEGVADRSDPIEESSHHLGLDWVDPRMTEFTFVYLNGPSFPPL